MKTRDYYVTPSSTYLMRKLWKAAGGDRYILERATFADQMKYMCLGGVVTATGIMAALAGGFAFYTIFEPKGSAIDQGLSLVTCVLSCIFGFFWGLMIFNIDRFIVTSTGKGDGTEAITWEEFKGAIPRILMGAIIAMTISKPVEIRMFKTEIDARLYEEQLKVQKDFENRTDSNFDERLKNVEEDLNGIRRGRQELMDRVKNAETDYLNQLNGRARNELPGDGPLAKALKTQLDNVQREMDQFDQTHAAELSTIEAKRQSILKEKEKALAQNVNVAHGLDGLLERIKLADEIAGWGISLFVTLLFLAIELTPIFFKLMLVKTPYDYLEDNVKELVKAENGIEVRYDYYKDKKGQERHLVIHHQVEKLIHEKAKATEAQKELIDYAIQKYIEQIKGRMDEDPNAFIKQLGDA
jgi:DNA-binding protein Fis